MTRSPVLVLRALSLSTGMKSFKAKYVRNKCININVIRMFFCKLSLSLPSSLFFRFLSFFIFPSFRVFDRCCHFKAKKRTDLGWKREEKRENIVEARWREKIIMKVRETKRNNLRETFMQRHRSWKYFCHNFCFFFFVTFPFRIFRSEFLMFCSLLFVISSDFGHRRPSKLVQKFYSPNSAHSSLFFFVCPPPLDNLELCPRWLVTFGHVPLPIVNVS